MSNQGLIAAETYATGLPEFKSRLEAERTLFSERDDALSALRALMGEELELDFSLESLNRLEKWYLNHAVEARRVDTARLAKEIGYYFGEVLCRQGGFEWTVSEFVFSSGRFEIGVGRGNYTVMLTKGILPVEIRNKRMHSLIRDAKRHIG